MKKKILSLLAAFFMLFGTSAMAQVDSTLEGDVNGDGVVDIADITAVIAIIKQNAEANPTYYWYAGQTKPTSMSSYPTQDEITSGTSDRDFKPNTWHPLAEDATSIAHTIVGGTSGNEWYVAVPTSFGFKPTASDLTTPDNAWEIDSTISINSIEYTIWRPGSTGTRRAVYMAKI